jgi:pSer/pThr/pTyr-binding forkhead associated (FHA) protein
MADGQSVVGRAARHCQTPLSLHAATRIRRIADNDIILGWLRQPPPHRHHRYRDQFPITDLQSANGVEVQRQRIRTSANLADGDHIRVADHEFTSEIS